MADADVENTSPEFDVGRALLCVPGLLVWLLACPMLLRLLTILGSDNVTFGPGASYFVPLWTAAAFLGLPIAGFVAYHTARGRVSLIWQVIVVLFGGLAFLLSLGD